MLHVITTDIFDRERLDDLCHLTTVTRRIAREPDGLRFLQQLLPVRRAMLYFTQPSTRTFLSMNNACHILGVRTSEIRNPDVSSEFKGETFEDSIRTFAAYVDMIIMRTPQPGYAARAADLMDDMDRRVPVINAGSGKDQHPTQALLDIYTLERSFRDSGGIEGKTIAMMGDLKRGRTVRSLCRLLRHYKDIHIVFIAAPGFEMEPDILAYLDDHEISYEQSDRLDDYLTSLDAIYVTRMQTEHDTSGESARVDLSGYSIGQSQIDRMKPDAVILHPLPRGAEIHPEIDDDPRAAYWRQERNGLWIRVALIASVLEASEQILSAQAKFL
ncbi:aspartate carbamoyltransferase [Hyphococcus sp.]|uniref:aspartate carbamoyltransferase n=1 Tax=Hyphococcus sp. TaxID=2038636 RepID=UPI003CCBF741